MPGAHADTVIGGMLNAAQDEWTKPHDNTAELNGQQWLGRHWTFPESRYCCFAMMMHAAGRAHRVG
jgi:hypothetical protein